MVLDTLSPSTSVITCRTSMLNSVVTVPIEQKEQNTSKVSKDDKRLKLCKSKEMVFCPKSTHLRRRSFH